MFLNKFLLYKWEKFSWVEAELVELKYPGCVCIISYPGCVCIIRFMR